MNRALFITAGIVIIIFVFLVWLFLFINGAPSNTREVFSDLGIVEPTPAPEVIVEDDEDRVVLGLSDGTLQQITTGPIAGYGTASTSDGLLLLRYVERGTGYIFEINLRTGLQTQLSPSTIPNATEAYFAPDLSTLVVVTERESRQVSLVQLPNNTSGEISLVRLDSAAENIQYLDNNTVTYTKNSHLNTVAYTYELDSQTVAERFVLTIPDAEVLTTTDGVVFAYPKPSKHFLGALYEVRDGLLVPYSQAEFGLIPFVQEGVGVLNYIDAGYYFSSILPGNILTNVVMLPQKCVASQKTNQLWCGAPSTLADEDYVESWYKGVVSSDDSLWEINTNNGSTVEIAVPKSSTGRQIDVINPALGPAEQRLFFQNKIDATLWLYTL